MRQLLIVTFQLRDTPAQLFHTPLATRLFEDI